MRLDLDAMRSEIQAHLESRGMAVFHGYSRCAEHSTAVYWDIEGHPDFRAFLAAAEASGVRLVTLYANRFTEDIVDDALERLSEASLPREEQKILESHLREMNGYIGFTCQIELSFDLAPRVYIFDLRTEWFDDLNEMLDRIDDACEEEEDDDEEPLSGYFSKN